MAFMVTLIASGGLFKALIKSTAFLSIFLRASSAACRSGKALSSSSFTSFSMAVALSTSTYTMASSFEIPSAKISAFSFSLVTTSAFLAAFSADSLIAGTSFTSSSCMIWTLASVVIIWLYPFSYLSI